MRRDARVTGAFAVSRVVGFVGAVVVGGWGWESRAPSQLEG